MEDGFFTEEHILSENDIARLIDSLSGLPRSRAGMRHVLHTPNVRSIANDARLLRLACKALQSPSAIPFRATLFDKSPVSNWKVSWHQDTALPLKEHVERDGWGLWSIKEGMHYAHAPTRALERITALRIHLDPSTSANGPLRVIPGTHQLGVLSDNEVAKIAQERSSIECLGGIGSVLSMRPLLIHASSKSQSTQPRRVLHIEYTTTLDIDDGMELAIA